VTDPPAAIPRSATPGRLRQDQKVERIIGVLLQTGVLLSILVALIGMTLYLGRAGRQVADFQVFRGEPFDFRGASAIVAAALAGRREAVIQLGVVILIATPIARVLLSLVAFALQRDRTYVVVTLIVLVVLLSGLFGVGP
jgi:uncharacterized membrane protein